ncbi:MAG: DNA polymerase I [Candidatus Krumholzibacteriota bacterium]|nr:DNA polymerase I [Candidatus Krumholzibacteriota bacterium]
MALFLIDGHAIAYRAYYAFIRNPLTNSKGQNTSAVFGFTRLVLRILEKYSPDYFAVVFDSEEATERHEKYSEYKAHRDPMPDDMESQFPVIIEVLESLGIPVVSKPGYEADDIIATLAQEAAKKGNDVRIISSDKDLFQILSDRIKMIRPEKGTDLSAEIGPEWIMEEYGLTPGQVVDFLAMMGDSADNIPGIRGIGKKTALKLLHEYGDMDSIFDNVETIPSARVKKMIQEGKSEGVFSRDLVKLTEVPVGLGLDDLKPFERDNKRLADLFLELEFHQMAEELSLAPEPGGPKVEYNIVGEESLGKLAGLLEDSGGFVLDVETTSLDPYKAELVGISFSISEGKAWYVPVSGGSDGGDDLFSDQRRTQNTGIRLERVREILGPVLGSGGTEKAGHNIKYDLKVLEAHGFEVANVTWDTMIASYCIDPSRRSHSLDNLALDIFRHRMIPYGDLFEKGDRKKDIRCVPLEKLAEYACEDSDYTFRLKEYFEDALKEEGLDELFTKIEMPLSFVLKKMEDQGMALDSARLEDLSKEISKEIERLTAGIHEMAGEVFNINSNKQLQKILFEKMNLKTSRKTKTGYSTDVRVLTDLATDHPFAGLILEYRQLSKLLSTYVDTLPGLVNKKTGMIHTSFNQTVAATGRLSSSDPNLQNIPIRTELGRKIRSAFIPSSGNILLDADYSQIELRVMAHLSGDPELVSAFIDGSDIHTRTASRIYGVSEEEVTKEMRSSAKTINFGVMYGQGAMALSKQLRIQVEEAKRFIDEYFEKYPGIKDFIDSSVESARQKGYAETLLGRRRPLPDINSSNGRFRSFSERIAVNMPIQGTSADLIKIAMIRISGEIEEKGLESRMILQVHDELVFDVVRGELGEMEEIVRRLMESAIELKVPLKVDMGSGSSWLEAH